MHKHFTRTFWIVLMAVIALSWTAGMASAYLKADHTPVGPGDMPDYLTTPNWAYTAPIRKFVDGLPGLGVAGANNLGQYMPVAIPDITKYPGSDYYEIQVLEFQEQMHSDLPPTTLRGYAQVNDGTDANGAIIESDKAAHYLGPIIIATKDRPVRVKFINNLPIGAGGNLFIPVDESVMGAGDYEIDYDPVTKATKDVNGNPIGVTTGKFSQNRALLHLHGGRSPWISDGTPHQWITPEFEGNAYKKGVSVVNVPDMEDPGDGAQTYYWTNQQSARLMFYHDHAWGITRLNVYVGEAAGYLITDDTEKDLVARKILPADMIPMVIQDKTYVDPNTIAETDPTWIWGTQPWIGFGPMTPVAGDLWWPHVYMPAQNPFDPSGIAPMGRWAYGPYFWPATNNPFQPVANPYYSSLCNPLDPNNTELDTLGFKGGFCQPPEVPSTPNPSWGAEAFMDTPTVNGTAYPVLEVDPKAYRMRILNAAHDRFWNLQMYVADSSVDPNTHVDSAALCASYPAGTTSYPGATPYPAGQCATETEVRMVDASPTAPDLQGTKPATWPEDGRDGGVPDWDTAGPEWIMVAAESGFLPKPVVIPNQPVDWNVDVTTFNAGNVNGGSLILAPAERADVVVDFTAYAGKTLILYNDAPAPWPALDPHYDYYTGAPDYRDIGGAASTPPGVGPNTRTIMQIKVATSATGTVIPFSLPDLEEEFIPADGITDGVFKRGQDDLIVGQGDMNPNGDPALYSAFLHDGVDYDVFNKIYHRTGTDRFPEVAPNWGVAQINDREVHFVGTDGAPTFKYDPTDTTLEPVTGFPLTGGVYLQPKAIQDEQGETFDDYGRMRAALGLSNINRGAGVVNFTVQTYSDPSTEIIGEDETQVWKITHNGVDTHPIHFHLFDVQILNRVGWDGFMRFPDPTEFGWKDTVRISPLEDTIVAVRPITPRIPFGVPESYRPLNPARIIGDTTELSLVDPNTSAAWATPNLNRFVNNDWEYVWHCHILSHEENDMMRSIQFKYQEMLPLAPENLTADSTVAGVVDLTWTDTTPGDAPATLGNRTNEVQFQVERSVDGGAFEPLAVLLANSTSYSDTNATVGPVYRYRVYGANATNQTTGPAGKVLLTPGFKSNEAAYPPIPVEIVNPLNGINYLAPATLTVDVNAQASVDSVELFVNGVTTGQTVTSPASYNFNLIALPTGTYALTAVGTDNTLATSYTSVAVTIVVNDAPPIADFTFVGSANGPNIGTCETVSFTGTASPSNPDYAGDLTYLWSLIDSGTGVEYTSITTSPSYPSQLLSAVNIGSAMGTQQVTLTVTDSIGQSTTVVKDVTQVNHPPENVNANITGSAYVLAQDGSLHLMGSATDPETACGQVLAYEWDLNNDSVTDVTGSDVTVSALTLANLGVGPGTHIFSLTVTDGTSMTVVVDPAAVPPTTAPNSFNLGNSGTSFVPMTIQNPNALDAPVDGSTLMGTSETFSWTEHGADQYQLLIGSTQGGADYLVIPGGLPAGTTSYTANNLPGDGTTVHVRFAVRYAGVWSFTDTVYTAFTSLVLTTTSLADGAVNMAYSQQVTAADGTPPYAWTVTGLPVGLSMDPATGLISGTPENVVPSGSFVIFPVSISVTDSSAVTVNKNLDLRINQTAPSAPSGLLTSATTPTQVTLSWADNANNELGFSIQRATDAAFTTNFLDRIVYPADLTGYVDNGLVTGTTYYYRVRAGNAAAGWGAYSNTASVTPIVTYGITTTSLTNGGVNVAYSQSVTAVAGTPPYAWTAMGLPVGLSMDPATGLISGTPENVVPSGSFVVFPVSITVTDSTTATINTVLDLRINQTGPAAPSSLVATATTPTKVTLTWIDNAINESGFGIQRATDAGFTVDLLDRTIYPADLAGYADNTVVTGTTYYYRVRAGNAGGGWGAYSNTVTVTPIQTYEITTTSLASGGVNLGYSQQVTAAAGTPPYSWAATGLPTGLLMDPMSGLISGTPENVVPSGSFVIFPISITVTDDTTATINTVLDLRINQTAPAAPSSLVATATSPTQVTLIWIDNANNETGFGIQRATDAGFTVDLLDRIIYPADLTGYTDNTVVTGTTYYYRVRAANPGGGWGQFSNTSPATP